MKKGLTFVELLAAITLSVVLLGVITLYLNPKEMQKKARDVKRLSDLTKIERAINEYRMANGKYPGFSGVTVISTALPPGATQLQSSSRGWINSDLSAFIEMMPTDPINDSSYYYSYAPDDTSYELDARLEYYSDKMIGDGGNDPEAYEVGTNLFLMSP